MHETPDDIAELQALIDASYESSGEHLQRVIPPERRLAAAELCTHLDGMKLLVLATVTADGRPINGPVDGIFYRGHFYFGSAPDSIRFKHIAKRPQVSATHLPGEELSVTVHGTAVPIDHKSPDHAGFRRTMLDIYLPRYGAEWEEFVDSGPMYARIDPRKLFMFWMPEEH